MNKKPRWNEHVWTEQEDALLGTMADTDVAARLGISHPTVATRRKRLGIPAKPKARAQFDESLLGTMPDIDVARKTGMPYSAVRWRRLAACIPAYRDVARRAVEKLEITAQHADLAVLLSGLDERSIIVLALRAAGLTLDRIGKFLNVTRERVRQIEEAAASAAVRNFMQVVLKGKTITAGKEAATQMKEIGT